MPHINLKVLGQNEAPDGGYDDLKHFKREHLITTDGYVDDTGLVARYEDALSSAVVTCNECFVASDNATYHKLEIDSGHQDILDDLKTSIDAASSWDTITVSVLDDTAFNAASSGQTMMACCGNCSTGTELFLISLICRR